MSQIYKNSAGGAGGGIQTINGDVGSITGSTVTVFANNAANNSGSSVSFVNSGTVSTLNLSDNLANTILGFESGSLTISGTGNTMLGWNGLTGITSGISNTALGVHALSNTVSGSYNIGIGQNVGTDLTNGNESSNILIGSLGVAADQNTIRIGTQGTNPAEQNLCFIAGVVGNTVSNQEVVTINSVTGQLGTTTTANSSTQYFSAYLSAPTANVTGDGTLYGPILFDGILSNSGSNYNPATGLFTAPTTGQYSFTQTVAFNGGDTLTVGFITLWNGSAFGSRAFQNQYAGQSGTTILSACIFIPMTAGDTIGVQALSAGTNKNVQIYGAVPTGVAVTSLFSGFKVA